jgi:N-acetylglucosaminyl-diphospho-decaprenol L-rhamnosyltransferase
MDHWTPTTVAEAAVVRDLDVGVIYTGERDLMAPLVTSLGESAGGVWTRLLLVDNASADGVEEWRHVVPETVVLRNRQRLSYAANMNRILDASTARYVLLLNTDMRFDPAERCLPRMVSFMDARPDCCVAGCRLYRADGQYAYPARRFQTMSVVMARRCGLGRLMPRTLDRYLYRDRTPYETFQCDWLSGCFLMLRRRAFEEVGFFDESFGKYFEDVDMCLRMARSGWQVMYHGDTCCYHLEQRASRRPFSIDGWRHLRSYMRWVQKWGYRPTATPAAVPVFTSPVWGQSQQTPSRAA